VLPSRSLHASQTRCASNLYPPRFSFSTDCEPIFLAASTANSLPFDVSQPSDTRIHNHAEINANGIPKALAAAMAGIIGVSGMTPENSRGICSSA